MALGSVLQTALSGISAATTAISVASNNVANARTPGFKAGSAQYAPFPSSKIRLGSAPSASSGGTNPVQVGQGVGVVAIATDFSQGSFVASSSELDFALEGDGFFIVEGANGPTYTRAGNFHLNADGEIVTATGEQLLGYGVDENNQIDSSRLQPITVWIGSTIQNAEGTAATLTEFSIAEDGRIHGEYSDGVRRDLGQVQVARFANPSGLTAVGNGQYQPGPNAGLPIVSSPGEGATASLVSGAVELSNADIGQSIIEITLASQSFRANAAVLSSADSLLDELSHLRRA